MPKKSDGARRSHSLTVRFSGSDWDKLQILAAQSGETAYSTACRLLSEKLNTKGAKNG